MNDFITPPNHWYFEYLKIQEKEEEKFLQKKGMTKKEYMDYLYNLPIETSKRYAIGIKEYEKYQKQKL